MDFTTSSSPALGQCQDTVTMVVNQPSFLPWRGYFQLLGRADHFVLYDDVQYDKHGWRNRNQIKTHSGLQWITVPVRTKGKHGQLIRDAKIDDTEPWRRKILGSVRSAYRRSPYFDRFFPWLEETLNHPYQFLVDLDERLIREICGFYNIKTPIRRSSEFGLADVERIQRLVCLCQEHGANEYVSGPSASAYLGDTPLFSQNGIQLIYHAYTDLFPYPQLHGEFMPTVSVLDTLMCCGSDLEPLGLRQFEKANAAKQNKGSENERD